MSSGVIAACGAITPEQQVVHNKNTENSERGNTSGSETMKLLDVCAIYGVNDRSERSSMLKKAIKSGNQENALFLICFYDTWLRGKTTMAKGLLDVFLDPGDFGPAVDFNALAFVVDVEPLNIGPDAARRFRASWDGNVTPFLESVSHVLSSEKDGQGGTFLHMVEMAYASQIKNAAPDAESARQYAVLCQKFTERLGPYGFDRAYSCI